MYNIVKKMDFEVFHAQFQSCILVPTHSVRLVNLVKYR